MNINAIASTPLKIPMPAQPKVEQQTAAATAKPERMLTAAEEFSKKFYSKEAEPWNSNVDDFSETERFELGDRPTTREGYVEQQYNRCSAQLGKQYYLYTQFMEDLHFMDPDVAQKNWSYTLGPNGEIKVLDPKGNLTDAETDRLTEALNTFKTPNLGSFKENIQINAKTIMRIVDHDTKTFEGKYKLDLLNFHENIDYGKINFLKNERNDDWRSQMLKAGDLRNSPKIDVLA